MISEAEKKNLCIGYKQVRKALTEKTVCKLFLAEDCEDRLRTPLETGAQDNNVPVFYISTMQELGKLCGIAVGASCAAVLAD